MQGKLPWHRSGADTSTLDMPLLCGIGAGSFATDAPQPMLAPSPKPPNTTLQQILTQFCRAHQPAAVPAQHQLGSQVARQQAASWRLVQTTSHCKDPYNPGGRKLGSPHLNIVRTSGIHYATPVAAQGGTAPPTGIVLMLSRILHLELRSDGAL
jgi:hypothetical protein